MLYWRCLPISLLDLCHSLYSEVKREERRKADLIGLLMLVQSVLEYYPPKVFLSLIYSKCIEECVQMINKYIVNEIIECIYYNMILKMK